MPKPREARWTHTQIETQIRSVYSFLETTHGTLDQLNSAMRPIWDEMNSRAPSGRNRYTAYTRGFARGLHDALWHTLMLEKVEFVYRLREDVPEIFAKRGEIFSTHKVSAHRRTEEFYTAGIGSRLANAESTHVWIGTDCPISTWDQPRSNLPQNGILRGAKLYAA